MAGTFAALCQLAAPATAAPQDDRLDPPESADVDQAAGGGKGSRGWYRTPLALSYAVPLTLMPVGAVMMIEGDHDINEVGPWFFWAGALSLTAPPVVHWLHGNTGRGFLSLGGIVGGAIVGFAIGASAENQSGPKSGEATLAGGLARLPPQTDKTCGSSAAG